MSCIGFLTEQKSEAYIKKTLNFLKNYDELLFIKEKNIKKVKNVKFDIFIINQKIESIDILRDILQNTTYLIINTDIDNDFRILGECNLTIITYGFKRKATITVSSVEEENVFICIQRGIYKNNNDNIYPQEIRIKLKEQYEVYDLLIIVAILLLQKEPLQNKINLFP